MNSLLLAGFTSLFLALILTPLVRKLAFHFNLVDMPDTRRKFHARPVPRVGGIAIALSYAGALGFLLLVSSFGYVRTPFEFPLVLQLIPGAAVLFLTGVLDDLIGLRPWQKLIGQLAGAVLVCLMGVTITRIDGVLLPPWIGMVLTVAWLIGCTNAFNLIDGLDGLAAGVGLVATCTTLLAAILHGNYGLALATVPLAGCLLGFLRYNFNPASIFLGDCGSLLIGFLLGSYAIIWSQKSATLLGLTAPVMAMALPLLDVALSVSRRFIGNKPIFGADRGHIHHRLLSRGLTPKSAALILYGVCGVGAALSLMQDLLYKHAGGFIVILFTGFVILGVRQLNYVEFGVAHQLVAAGTFRRILQEEIWLREFKAGLAAVEATEDYWSLMRRTAADIGFRAVQMKLDGRHFREEDLDRSRPASWAIHITICETGFLILHRTSADSQSMVLGRFVELLQHHLTQRWEEHEAAAARGELALSESACGSLLGWQQNVVAERSRVTTSSGPMQL